MQQKLRKLHVDLSEGCLKRFSHVRLLAVDDNVGEEDGDMTDTDRSDGE